MIDTYVIPLLKILIVLNATLVGVTYMVLLERKVIAWAQSRLGPMRVGPYGVLQPVADAIKLMIKEDITPTKADRWVFTAAPIISMVPALIVYAVIPFGPTVHLFGREVSLYITDINVGLLYVVSVASVGVYGIILAGYASNSKFPLLASLRASAQLISYEVAVTLTLVSVASTRQGGRADRPGGGWACGLFAAALAFPDHDRDGNPVCAGDAVGWAVRSSRGSGRAGPLRGGWRCRAWRLRRRGSCGLCRGSGPRVWRFHRRGRRLPRVPGRRLRGG